MCKLQETPGPYQLLPQPIDPNHNVPSLTRQVSCDIPELTSLSTAMCESETTNEEVMSTDDFEGELVRKASNPGLINHHQREADENLFLR